VNKLSKPRRSLSGVAAQLIYLARRRFDVQNGVVLDGLLDGRRYDAGVGGTDGVHANPLATSIATDEFLQMLTCALGLRFHG